jgi:prepilin peptidase CpaA
VLETPASAAAAFLPFVAPIALWVAWSDMARMKIPNQAVLALTAVFLIAGPVVLPLGDWALRWLHLAVVLVLGFVANAAGLLGAGDAKFAAAAAPFVAVSDALGLLTVFAAILLGAFAAHRLMRAFPPFREAVPHWESWTHGKFPMGLALGPALALYLVLCLFYGA